MKFVHLHTHSHYSLLDGLSKIPDLLDRVKELGMTAVALTDHGNLYGAVEFYKEATKREIKPILGCEMYVAPGSRLEKKIGKGDDRYFHLTLLAENNDGWKNLIQLATLAALEGFYYKPRIDKEILRQYSKGLIGLSGCPKGEIPQLILNNNFEAAKKAALEYEEIFGKGNFFLEIGHHPHIPEAVKAKDGAIKIHQETGIPLIATQDIHYLKPEDAQYQDILLAVQTGNKLNDDDRLTLKADDFSMFSPEQAAEFFKDFSSAVENTVKIADRCNIRLVFDKFLLPKFDVPDNSSAYQYLEKLLNEKLSARYPSTDNKAKERLAYELSVIEKTKFADYFLIVQDVVNWAKERGIAVGPGRGSAAGSIVSYILGVTDIDPLKYDLLFERFLNPERITMPDIDIDFADKRRDEVFAYMREKYGQDKVAQIITFGTMMARGAVRDVTRAMGFPYTLGDQISKLIPFGENLKTALETVEELKSLIASNPDAKKILEAAEHLEGVVRHASVHACGLVVAEDPLINYVPLQYAPQSESIIITQFEMNSIEALGLLKMDFLGLKNLTIIEETIRLIKEIRDESLDISQIPLDDKKTFELLQKAETVSIFQLESDGMRRWLKELKPTDFEDIIVMNALYRPGPINLIPSYIKRKHGVEKVEYLHPKLEPILKNTQGILVYQEQVMRIVQDLCGFTLGEADVLRRAIGKKIRSLMLQQKEKFISGAKKNNIGEKIAIQIWDWIEPFADYSFNRSHAACYALIGYRTAYLKAHYPLEFLTALFNADSGDVERIAFLIGEAKKMNVKVLPPDINKSFSDFAPEDNAIRFGILSIKNVGAAIVEAIIEERFQRGPFENFENFLNRVSHKDLNKKSLESLIKAGALDSINIERGMLLANIDDILAYSQNVKKSIASSQDSLFGSEYKNHALKLKSAPAATAKEKFQWEKELVGLYITDHPLNRYADKIQAAKAKPIKEIKNISEQQAASNGLARIAGAISSIKKIIAQNNKPMIFVKIEDLSDTIEVVVFDDILSRHPALWRENNILIVEGKLSYRDNEPKIIVSAAVEVE